MVQKGYLKFGGCGEEPTVESGAFARRQGTDVVIEDSGFVA